jgi:hypothetical protein
MRDGVSMGRRDRPPFPARRRARRSTDCIGQHVVSGCHPAGVDQPRNFAASTSLQDHLLPFKIDFAGSMGVHYEVILKWRARRSRGFCLVDGIGVLVAKVSTVDTVDNPVEELGPGSGKS